MVSLLSPDYEPVSELSGESLLRASSRNVLRFLWQDWQDPLPRSLFSLEGLRFFWRLRNVLPIFIDAILITKNPQFVAATRDEISQLLARLGHQLQEGSPSSPTGNERLQLVITNILSIYALFEPNPHETVTVPIFDEQKKLWQTVEYQITPIEMSPQKGIWRWFMNDEDRLFSYGLSAISAKDAPSLLLHRGTTWPTSQGIMMQILADSWSNKTPGEIFFEWGGKKLEAWLNGEEKVISCGQSLGGSMGYLSAMRHPDKIKKVIALSPPGMAFDYPQSHPLFGQWERQELSKRPRVIIQKQAGDIVSKCGLFKPDFELIGLDTTPENHPGVLPLKMVGAHARGLASNQKVTISHMDMATENQHHNRQRNNHSLYGPLRSLVFYLQVLPYFFIARPLVQFVKQHWLPLLIATVATLCLLVPPINALLLPILTGLAGSYLGFFALSFVLSHGVTCLIESTTGLLKTPEAIGQFFTQSWPQQLKTIGLGALNIITMGFAGKIKALVIDKTQDWHATPCTTHTPDYQTHATDYRNFSRPSFIFKASLIGLFSLGILIVLPLRLLFIELPRGVYQIGVLIHQAIHGYEQRGFQRRTPGGLNAPLGEIELRTFPAAATTTSPATDGPVATSEARIVHLHHRSGARDGRLSVGMQPTS